MLWTPWRAIKTRGSMVIQVIFYYGSNKMETLGCGDNHLGFCLWFWKSLWGRLLKKFILFHLLCWCRSDSTMLVWQFGVRLLSQFLRTGHCLGFGEEEPWEPRSLLRGFGCEHRTGLRPQSAWCPPQKIGVCFVLTAASENRDKINPSLVLSIERVAYCIFLRSFFSYYKNDSSINIL